MIMLIVFIYVVNIIMSKLYIVFLDWLCGFIIIWFVVVFLIDVFVVIIFCLLFFFFGELCEILISIVFSLFIL